MNENTHESDASGELISPPVPADPRFDFSTPEDVSFEEFKTPTGSKRTAGSSTTVHGGAPAGAEPAEDPLIGEVVGNYLILSLLGKGGFGTVYKARDAKLERYIAIKFLQYPRDADFHRRFAREARVIANLSKHPNIVQIHSWGEHRGQSYFVLEHMDYSSDALLDQYPDGLPLVRALEIGRDCARGLSHAHSNGVLHRDIKPGNILIDNETGQAKLCDFGLAISHGPGDERTSTVVAGSPLYMSPEQFSGEVLDERSDIYSLGITLYRLLTNKLPYKKNGSGSYASVLQKQKRKPLQSARPDLPRSVVGIVERCIELNSSRRYQSAEALRIDIEDVLRSVVHSGTAQRASGLSATKKWPLRLALAVGAVVASASLFYAAFERTAVQEIANSTGADIPPAGATHEMNPPVQDTVNPVSPGLAEADDLLRLGRAEDAAYALNAELTAHPSADAEYLMAYASLMGGDFSDATRLFDGLPSEELRSEGQLAVARWTEESTEPPLVLSPPTPYGSVLLASISMETGDAQAALDRLESVEESDLNWSWQKQERQRLIGMALYRLGRYAVASETLNEVSDDVASYYAKLAGRQLNQERRSEIRNQIANIREAMDRNAIEKPTADEVWTSRPIRLRISPASAGASRLAIDSDLVGAMPGLLADALVQRSHIPLKIVDREYLGDALYEQELADLSSDPIDRGRLVGATRMVELEFGRIFDENYLRVKIIDTRTTEVAQTQAIRFDRSVRSRVTEWTEEVADSALESMSQGFPIQARLTVDEIGPVINVGRNVGLRKGVKFRVFAAPALEREIARVSAQVTGEITQATARVELLGASAATVPESGWYLREVRD